LMNVIYNMRNMIIQEFQYPKKLEDLMMMIRIMMMMMMKNGESIDDQQNQSEKRFASQIIYDQLQLKHDCSSFHKMLNYR
jgi:hypothetical protein